MDKKTSLLQKNILTTIYSQGAYEEQIAVVELNPAEVNVDFQLKKLKRVKERGGILFREEATRGLTTQIFKVQSYQLTRSKLACFLFGWHKLNIYLKLINTARLRSEPDNYSSRQAALTSSLKSLESKEFVELQDVYGDPLSESDRKRIGIVYLTTEGIAKAESILTIKLKNTKTNLIVSK